MDFHIGAPIYDRDGDHVGNVKHVVIDPETREVAEIVLGESGILGREVVVPIGAVETAEQDRVDVALDREQVKGLTDFTVTSYQAPPPELFGGAPWANAGLVAQGVAPVGAATGLESIAFTPIVDTTQHIPEGDVDLSPGTDVYASDGKVGSIRDVIVDEQTNRVRAFIVEKGFVFHEDVEVSVDQVARFDDNRVTLTVAKEDLKPVNS